MKKISFGVKKKKICDVPDVVFQIRSLCQTAINNGAHNKVVYGSNHLQKDGGLLQLLNHEIHNGTYSLYLNRRI